MGTPNYPKDLASEWNKVRRDVKSAFTSANLRTGMAKIGAKVIEVTGSLIMNAGAVLEARYTNNNKAMIVGRHYAGTTPVDGIVMFRPNGQASLWSWGNTDTGDGFFGIYDESGNIIISDDSFSGQGLARPWLPYTWVDYDTIVSPRKLVTATTFTGVHTVTGYLQHPKMEVYGYLQANGTDVAQWRVRNANTGTILATSGNITSGFNGLVFGHEDYQFGNSFRYDIEIRRVSGTSTGVGYTPLRCHGIQS